MKILIVYCFISSFSFAQDNLYDSLVYQCIKESFSAKGVDFETELAKFEDFLISSNQFDTINGISLYNYFEKIASSGIVEPFIEKHTDWADLRKVKPAELYSEECRGQLRNLVKSEKSLKLDEEFSKIRNVSPGTVAQAVINVLSPADLNKEPFRTKVLLMIVNTAIEPEVPSIPAASNSEELEKLEKFTFDLRKVGTSSYDLTTEELKTICLELVRNHPKSHCFEIIAAPSTTYQIYLNTTNFIAEIYNTVKSEFAKEKFRKNYSNLSEEEKSSIDSLIEPRVIETIGKGK